MKLFNKKWAGLTLILAMLISLLPPMTAYAAATLQVTNLYSPDPSDPTQFKDDLVDRFTLNPIDINVLINGLTESEIPGVYFEIENMTTSPGQPSVNKTNKAVKASGNNNEITFKAVNLTAGLNKITVKYGASGGVASKPAYAYFTPVTNISGLKFNTDNFIDAGMYPTTAPYTGINITGNSFNADTTDGIEANYNGTVFKPSAFINGAFTFVANTGRPTDIEFNPGDNKITFAAKNSTNYYTTTRSFVYNNGKAIAYNAKVDLKGTTANQPLVDNPILESSGTTSIQDVNIEADFKIDPTVVDYVYAFTNGPGGSGNAVRYNFGSPSGAFITHVNLQDGTTVGADSVSPGWSASGSYHFSGQFPVDLNKSYQEIFFVFIDKNGVSTTTKYNFTYVDKSQPYIKKVSQVRTASGGGSSYEADFSESGTVQITDFPASLKVYTDDNGNTDEVAVEINGQPYTFGADATSKRFPVNSTTKVADVSLQGITDGPAVMKVIPYKGGSLYTAGVKQYNLVISGAAYVILNNVYNGMVVDDADKLRCASVSVYPCIAGRIVNIANDVDYGKVVYKLNGIPLTPTVAPTVANGGVFSLQDFNDNTKTPKVPIFGKDGKYTLTIDLIVSGQPITTSSVDIFVLSDNVPSIISVIPKEADALNPEFILDKSLPDTYVTQTDHIVIKGQVANSAVSNSATTPGTVLYLRKSPSTGAGASIIKNLSPVNGTTFESEDISLKEYGQYVFELVASNSSSGSTANRVITITHEPVPYAFVSPSRKQIIKNTKGVDQANINQNYYMLELQADQADSVVFGKDTAILDKNTGHFFYEIKNLKAGANEVKFTVNRGTNKLSGSIVLFYTNVNMVGAQFKSPLASSMKVFDSDIQLTFPKDTKLMRYDNTTEYISTDRQILFGIANNDDGRVVRDDAVESRNGTIYMVEPTGRFKPASKRFWVDAGIISSTANSTNPTLQDAYLGSGYLPNTLNAQQTPFYLRSFKDIVVPTKQGTITLKYDSNIVDDSWKYLTVYQYTFFDDPNGTGMPIAHWKNLGGKVDTSKNTITVPVDSFGYFQVMYMNNSYNDVTNHSWARDDLDTLYSKGIMNGKTDGAFLPNDGISRGEFVTMLVDIFNIPLVNPDTEQTTSLKTYTGTFLDVQKGYSIPGSNGGRLFDYQHIEAAARAGIVRGNANGLFLPNNTLTRQDAAVMIARAANMKLNSDSSISLAGLKKIFTDADTTHMDVYAIPSIEAVNKAKLIEGIENETLQGQKKPTYRFDAFETFTRAQAAAVAIRVLKQQKIIPK